MSSAELEEAINQAVYSRLKSLLKTICAACPEARQIAQDELLATLLPDDKFAKGSSNKRTKRFEICKNCKEEFDIGENDEDSCLYHDADLEVDLDAGIWADHDVNAHGPYDTEQNRKDYPEGFTWECCGAEADAEGCMVDWHEADENPIEDSKKSRL